MTVRYLHEILILVIPTPKAEESATPQPPLPGQAAPFTSTPAHFSSSVNVAA